MQTQRQCGLQQSTIRFTLRIAILIGVALLARPVAAQSTDPFHPTPITTETFKARWPKGERISHYYSFIGGPGVVKVAFEAITDGAADIVGGQLTDADGHGFMPLEYRGTYNEALRKTTIGDVIYERGARFIGTYEIKRRQQLIFRFFTDGSQEDWGGRYTVKVYGDGVAFGQDATTTGNATVKESPAGTTAFALPKNGKLRLVMKDGTIQEINLSNIQEATIKP